MPLLNEVINNRDAKKFIKKSYRPWDLGGERKDPTTSAQKNSEPNIQGDDTPSDSKVNDVLLELTQNPADILDNNICNNKVTIREQLDNNKITIGKQLDNNKITTKVAIREQLDNSLDPTTLQNRILNLSGIQKNILEFIADICSMRGEVDTGPIETNMIVEYVRSTNGSVKVSINRLINKGFLIRNKGRTAKGGYINFSIPKKIQDILFEQRDRYQKQSNPSEMINRIRQQLDNKVLYSSSSYINKTTTTKKENVPKEWEILNYEPLSDIGFNKTQIKQLIGIADPTIVQESILHFAYGLQHNQKMKKYNDPLNVLMGVLRKGQAWFEKDYRSLSEIAQQQFLERKKEEFNRKKVLMDDTFKLALEEWKLDLTKEDMDSIYQTKNEGTDFTPKAVKLSIYFKENMWPNIKSSYLMEE